MKKNSFKPMSETVLLFWAPNPCRSKLHGTLSENLLPEPDFTLRSSKFRNSIPA